MRWGPARSTLLRAALALSSVSALLSAQTGVVSGRVTDAAAGTPISGATIRVVGTQIGGATGVDGRYIVRGVPAGTIRLQVNRIGFEVKAATVTVVAGQTATADVALAQAALSLSEVVVTVTGAQRKAEISNTVASVDIATKATETSASTLGQLLSGQAAGVQILSAGAAGGGSRIRIRGQSSLSLSNAPVVYVDGVKVTSAASTGSATGPSRFDDLNPDEIETVDVLKGPAAATLYGTEAANGVINITTKKGKAGSTRWSFINENGTSYDSHKGHYRDLWISFDKTKVPGTLTQCLVTQVAAGTCHIDSTYHGNVLNNDATSPIVNGNVQKYGLQVSGGNDRNQYFISGEYNKELGPYKMPQPEVTRLEKERGTSVPYNQIYPNADTRMNLRTNLSTQLSSNADFAVSIGYLGREDRQPQNEDNSVGLMVDAIAGLARTDLKDPRGIPLNGYRSYPMGDIFAQEGFSDANRFTNSLALRYYPTTWLNTRANLGFDFLSRNDKDLVRFDQGPFGETSRQGTVASQRTELDQYTVDLGATGTFTPRARFSSKTSTGVQYYRTYTDNTRGTGQNLTPGATQVTAAAIRSGSESTDLTITLGTYVEQIVSYADRVFLTGGVRYDGNSAFGKEFKGVFYPKVGLSWLVSDESFFPQRSWLTSLRLRGTYGASGVQPGTTDAARFFSPITATISGGTDSPGVTLSSLGNKNLKPEYSGEFETGLDAALFNNRTSVELTYYNKKTKDALIARPVAPSLAGISTVFDNLGSVRNQGFEMTVNHRFIDNANYGFDAQLTGSTNKNRILALGEGVTPVSTGNRATQYNAPGYPLYGLWGKLITYTDANNDGYLNIADVKVSDTAVYIAPSFPTLEMAFNPRVELLKRRLAISAQIDHKQGMDKFNNTNRHQCQGGLSCQGFWDPQASLWEQARTIAVNNYSVYTGMYENGRFTRLREITVSYQLPDRLANRVHSNRASLIAAGRNLHVWTPYSGVDPETTVGNGDQRGNEEYFATAPLRYFTIRLNLGF
jgi:TonB-linked SusC/RagA family outer membrane protein